MTSVSSSRFLAFLLQLAIFLGVPASLSIILTASAEAQIKPVYDQGALGLGRLLKRLNTSASVMMIGAHPDDEDTALLTYLARGENARTAYLSLTRGDGGQNIIGPELGEALGVIRTEELLQARKLDGAEQYFTRAYDYGFSKTLDEAKQKWDEKIILCDVVRTIRSFRPLVVVSQFSGTPADGHGQHQFAGYISPIAVKAAADASQCSEAGAPWQVKKVYVRHGFRATGEPRLRVNTGKFDSILGRSYFEIAMEARSQHRSQEQGVLELKGEAFSGLNLSGSETKETGMLDSLDTSVAGIAENTGDKNGRLIELLNKLQSSTARARGEFDVQSPEKIIPILMEGYESATRAEQTAGPPAAKAFLLQKQIELLAAVKLAAGIQFDAISDKETVATGESFNVASRVFYPSNDSITVKSITIRTPNGWSVSETPAPTVQTGNPQARREVPRFGSLFAITVPENAMPTQPYWLREPRKGDAFTAADGTDMTLPLQPAGLTADVTMSVAGREIVLSQPIEYRYADDVRGEIRRPVAVVPRVSVSLDRDLLMIARSNKEITKEVSVTVTNNSSVPVAGKANLALPNGWSASSLNSDFTLPRKSESTSVKFVVRVPRSVDAGSHTISASADIRGMVYQRSMRVVAYPHIQTHRLYRDTVAKANVLDLKVVAVKVGYLAGSGDRVHEGIDQMGFDVETIDEQLLASGDISRFDVIVVGIRAYQVRPDLVSSNKRLLDFANAGGTLIVQYQLPAYTQQNLAPFPAQQGPRVSDELAKVTVLDANHPILNTPNKITDADFDGWVQERNLYNFSTMDAKYTGLLESHDANEAENKGGLVVADVGKGKYIYCSYSLFRQLPAGVPGAYRLLANMLAYSGKKQRSGK